MKNLILFTALMLGILSAQAQEVLIFSGGMKGHKPHEAAGFMKLELEKLGCTVTSTSTMDCLDDAAALAKYDLIIPNWTLGEISETQLKNLLDAVKSGAGLAGIHGGMGDAFRKTPEYEAMVGGQFLKHPYKGEYTVDARLPDHPVMNGVPASFVYSSEKYFMRMADTVTVLADTDYSSVTPELRMPVVWVHNYKTGRVFYSALGHNVMMEYKRFPEAARLFINGCLWAARQSNN